MKNPLLAFISDWWRSAVDSDVVLQDYRYSKDLESSITHGLGSTPSTDNATDIYESIVSLNNLQLHYDVIKLTLEELSNSKPGSRKIPTGIEWLSVSPQNISKLFQDASSLEVNVALLWAAFLKRSDLVRGFLDLGAQASFYEHNYGLSALHLAAYSGCEDSTEYLLSQKGCYVNAMCKCFSPLHCAALGESPNVAAILLEKGANIDAFTNDLHCRLEGVLHCAVRANALACLKLFCDKGANINQLDSAGRTAIHLAAELGHPECLGVLVEAKGANVDQQTKEKQRTALHFAAQNRHPGCVDVLLDHGATPSIPDYRHHTPLHLAAKSQCNDCVKTLLQKGKANPNQQDIDLRTALHLAVAQPSRTNSCLVIKTLIRYGADVKAKDNQGDTPLHLAAQHELSECVETLISLGADITAKSRTGLTALRVICQKTPAGIEAIKKALDSSIVFSHHDVNSKEFELQIDFSVILQHCHPREITFLNTLLDEGQKELLLHPVCTAFLHLKWRKIRKFFVFRALCCFLLVLSMSAYVLMGLAKHCYNFSKNVTVASYEQDKELCLNHSYSGSFIAEHPYVVEIEWYLMVIFAIGIIIRKLCGMAGYSSIAQYVCTLENFLDWATVATVFLISFVYTGRTYTWQNHVSAFGVLIAWTNFLYILGQFPFFGLYIAMYSSVQGEFAKLLLVFSCLLVGFTVSFCVLFPESEVFSNIYIGFITVLVMAIGEMNLDLITTQPSKDSQVFMLQGSMEIIYATFVTCVTIILLNLLVGIAVHDIQGLKKTAKLAKLSKETKLISCIERALFTDYFHKNVLSQVFRWRTLVSVKGHCVLTIKLHHHNREDVLLPKEILESAYEVARKHKRRNKRRLSLRDVFYPKAFVNDRVGRRRGDGSEGDLSDLREAVRNLNNELLNVKSVLEGNQRLLEQLLIGGVK